MSETQRSEIVALTVLRGVAALWVTVFHMRTWLWSAFPQAPNLVRAWVNSGYLGVDLFFVLSGYVIALRYYDDFTRDGRGAYFPFLIKRFARIFPAHIAALVFCFLIWVSFVAWDVPYHAMETRFPLDGLIKSALLVQSWGYPIEKQWNVPDWSVSAEWLAYLLFPLFVHLPQGKKLRSRLVFLSSLLCLNALFLMSWNRTGAASIGLWRILIAFPLGMGLERLARRAPQCSFSPLLGGACLLFFVGPLHHWSKMVRADPLIWAPLWCAGVVWLLSHPQAQHRLLRRPGFVHLGRISYALYLSHALVLLVAGQLMSVSRIAEVSTPVALLFLIGAMIVMLLTAHVLYTRVEVPAQKWILAYWAPMTLLPTPMGAGETVSSTRVQARASTGNWDPPMHTRLGNG